MQRRSFHPIVVMLTVFLVLAGLQTVAQPAAATTASVDVQTAGTGTGRVVSDRTGIACPPTCSATFPDPNPAPVTLTVTKSGAGTGTVTSDVAGINCGPDCDEAYAPGTLVTLTAAASVGSTFSGWSGACTGTGACNVTVTSATGVTAAFTLQNFTLGVVESGTGGGVVTSNPIGITCPGTCSASYAYGQVVVLTATPDGSSTFAGWSGGSCSGTGTCIVTIDTAKSVTATFDPISSFTTASTSDTVVVTLTAIPAPDSYFAGWSGGTCSGTAPTCTLSFADDGSVTAAAVTVVVATFNRIPHPPGGHGSPADDGSHRHRDCRTDPGYDPSNDPACRSGRQ